MVRAHDIASVGYSKKLTRFYTYFFFTYDVQNLASLMMYPVVEYDPSNHDFDGEVIMRHEGGRKKEAWVVLVNAILFFVY